MRMPINNSSVATFAFAAVLAAAAGGACTPNQRIVNSSTGQWSNTQPGNTEAAPKASSFEQDLESMRTADFVFIYVFRRKDGAPLDADDKRFASQMIPAEMNRRSVSDEGKAILIGSNFRMPEENLKLLTERFAFADHSAPGAVKPSPTEPAR